MPLIWLGTILAAAVLGFNLGLVAMAIIAKHNDRAAPWLFPTDGISSKGHNPAIACERPEVRVYQ